MERNRESARLGELSRRQFVGAAAGAAAGAVALGAAGAARGEEAPSGGSAAAEVAQAQVQALDSVDGEAFDPSEVRKHAARLNPQTAEGSPDASADMSAIFSPWQFGPLTLPNRIVKSAAGVSAMSYKGGIDNEETLGYYSGIARGGCKMLYMDDICVQYEHFEFPPVFPPFAKITDWTPDQFKRLTDAVHAEGAYFGYQLANLGMALSQADNSQVNQSLADTITADEIQLLIEDTVNAAKNLQSYGFDAVEINAAGSNLGQNFMSRFRNHRDDDYGPQTLENRCRFVTDVIKGIKQECGEDFPVQVLMNGVEDNDGTIGQNYLHTTVEEAAEMAKLLEAAGADALHVRLGPSTNHICEFMSDLYFTGRGISGTTSFGTQFDFDRHWQGRLKHDESGLGLMVPVAAQIKRAVSIPVGCVTYMDPSRDPEFFNSAIADGDIDFMLMNRPLNVDSEYVSKLEEGRFDEIAPCTRCASCYLDTDKDGNYFSWCRVNAAFHRAYRDDMPEGYECPSVSLTPDGSVTASSMPEGPAPTPAETPKKVMVIGGGPAGMEAARVAAQRGHDVTLYEKSESLGGLLDFANAVKGPHENLLAFKGYLEKQLELEGVKVVTGTEATAETVAAEAPDAVIVATGGARPETGIQAGEGTQVVQAEDVLGGEVGQDVVVLGGAARAVDIALYLQAQGKRVNIVMDKPIAMLDWGQSAEARAYATPMLYGMGTRVWPEASVQSAGGGEAVIMADSGVAVAVPCETIVDASDLVPDTSLAEGLGVECYTVGDCLNPYNIANAVATGNLAARRL